VSSTGSFNKIDVYARYASFSTLATARNLEVLAYMGLGQMEKLQMSKD